MGAWDRALFAATVLSLPGTAHAKAGVSLMVSLGTAHLRLAGDRFIASGKYPTGDTANLNASGADIGASTVEATQFTVEIQGPIAPHVAIGVLVAGLWSTISPPSNSVGEYFSTGLRGVEAGAELSTFWPFRWTELRVSLALGYRHFDIDTLGLQVSPCAYNRYHQPVGTCGPVASSASFFVEPRVYLGLRLVPVFTFGGFAGGNVMPDGGWVAGAYVSASTPQWRPRRAQ